MKEQQERKFVNGLYAYKNTIEWKPFTLSAKIDEVIASLEQLRPLAKDGFIKIDVMQKYGEPSKFFTQVNTYQPKQEVTSAQHSPNRQPVQVDESGLPF